MIPIYNMSHCAKSGLEVLNIRVPIHVKERFYVKPIPVGKPWVVNSIHVSTKASKKVKYFRPKRLLSNYLREVM